MSKRTRDDASEDSHVNERPVRPRTAGVLNFDASASFNAAVRHPLVLARLMQLSRSAAIVKTTRQSLETARENPISMALTAPGRRAEFFRRIVRRDQWRELPSGFVFDYRTSAGWNGRLFAPRGEMAIYYGEAERPVTYMQANYVMDEDGSLSGTPGTHLLFVYGQSQRGLVWVPLTERGYILLELEDAPSDDEHPADWVYSTLQAKEENWIAAYGV